ncbi:MAG: type II toxin-antitoxin system VapC family toxin [Verrucomicrobiota bacterium]
MNALRYLLDTNIVSELVRDPAGLVKDHIARVGEETVCVSIVVAAELRFGAAKRNSRRLTLQVEAILSALPILALESPVDEHYAEIRAALEKTGNLIGPNDLLIAAHARALGLTLVTGNFVEFARVPALTIENWLTSV